MVRGGSAPQHIAKAIRFARMTRVLLADGMADGAASEAYYAVFHLAQALLACVGQAAETHAGVHTLFARHFVKNGPMPRDASQRFQHLMTDRLLAHYGVDDQIDVTGGRRAVANAVTLIEDIIPTLEGFAAEATDGIASLKQEMSNIRQVLDGLSATE
jgi:uncharacterized protein (UPF0332 family)